MQQCLSNLLGDNLQTVSTSQCYLSVFHSSYFYAVLQQVLNDL
jgi:hypothetical protein